MGNSGSKFTILFVSLLVRDKVLRLYSSSSSPNSIACTLRTGFLPVAGPSPGLPDELLTALDIVFFTANVNHISSRTKGLLLGTSNSRLAFSCDRFSAFGLSCASLSPLVRCLSSMSSAVIAFLSGASGDSCLVPNTRAVVKLSTRNNICSRTLGREHCRRRNSNRLFKGSKRRGVELAFAFLST